MSVLAGNEGELVSVRISTSPHLLEDLLECLATIPFPINPQIYHGRPTVVGFPAYRNQLFQVRDALGMHGFNTNSLSVSSMLEAIATAG